MPKSRGIFDNIEKIVDNFYIENRHIDNAGA